MTCELRDRTAAELATWLKRMGLDAPWSDAPGMSTRMLYAPDSELYEPSRLRLHEELIDQHRDSAPAPRTDGALAFVVTAGPPGAGKSRAIGGFSDLADFRHVDADDFKDPLLEHARSEGLLEAWTDHMLLDGRPVAPRELSAFVHAESTAIADASRSRALGAGENVVMHGTLSHDDYVDDLLAELDRHGYERLIVVDVNVPLATALRQSVDRWWKVRQSPSDPLGGRFIPPDAIRMYYPDDASVSRCTAHARTLKDRAVDRGWDVSLRSAS